MASEMQAELTIGPGVISAYSRLNYTMWYALAEFIDNSTQSLANYEHEIWPILESEGTPLVVTIMHDRVNKRLTISDNSIGMDSETIRNALRIAYPTADSRGRSKYGMGLKTAAFWIGNRWTISTARAGSGVELVAKIDLDAVIRGEGVSIITRDVDTSCHHTTITIERLNRTIQGRTEETIREYLAAMYRYDLLDEKLKIVYNNDEITPVDEDRFDIDEVGVPYKRDLPPTTINGKVVQGWIGVLKPGAGGRKQGGFSLFQNRRQIQGYPAAWKPSVIFGGVDGEGANNLVAQRLTGVLELEGFEVSHTKDAILFMDSEQELLEQYLDENTHDYREYAARRRSTANGTGWSQESARNLLDEIKREFETPELRDAATEPLPPLDTILQNDARLSQSVSVDDLTLQIDVLDNMIVNIVFRNTECYAPYLTVSGGAEANTIQVIVNLEHPYYASLNSADARDECIRQYVYDAIAEYRVSKQHGQVNPSSVHRKKDALLRARISHLESERLRFINRERQSLVDDEAN